MLALMLVAQIGTEYPLVDIGPPQNDTVCHTISCGRLGTVSSMPAPHCEPGWNLMFANNLLWCVKELRAPTP